MGILDKHGRCKRNLEGKMPMQNVEKVSDRVYVIRCRYCLFWSGNDEERHKCLLDAVLRRPDWYCPAAERRKER